MDKPNIKMLQFTLERHSSEIKQIQRQLKNPEGVREAPWEAEIRRIMIQGQS
jgi:hypothetical protein